MNLKEEVSQNHSYDKRLKHMRRSYLVKLSKKGNLLQIQQTNILYIWAYDGTIFIL